jgi:hypothetical protein
MPAKLYRVKLLEAERNDLKALINKSRIAARKQTHVRILLHCDESGVVPAKRDQERVCQRFVEEGAGISPKSERSFYSCRRLSKWTAILLHFNLLR